MGFDGLLLRMGTNGKYAIRIFIYIIRMYSNIRIEKSSMFSLKYIIRIIELRHWKTNNLHIRKQRCIFAFVFAPWIVLSPYFLNRKWFSVAA